MAFQAAGISQKPSLENLPSRLLVPLAVPKTATRFLSYKKLFAADFVVGNHQVVRFPSAAQSFAPDEALSQSVLKNVVFGHQLAQGIHVPGVDPFDELHDGFHWCWRFPLLLCQP